MAIPPSHQYMSATTDTAIRHIPLLSLPPGRHPMAGGSLWEVDQITINNTNEWTRVNFSEAMPGTPKVFLTVQGEALEPSITPRLARISQNSFQVALQEEYERQGPTPVTITWLAVHSPTGEGSLNINGQTATYQLTQANLINTGWTAIGENDYRLLNEPNGPPEQISEAVAILTLDGQAFGQIQSLNHCDKVVTLASREDKPTAGESGLYFLHTNQIDTATLITDQNRNVVWEATMAPFGEVNILTEEIENPLRFPGQYFDSETGLYYNWHRYYDPVTGRYITSDPIGLEGGLNTYAYAFNEPLRHVDVDGLKGSSALNRYRKRRDSYEDLSDLVDPHDYNADCVFGWRYTYVWLCRNFKPSYKNMCGPRYGEPDYIRVRTQLPSPPNDTCTFLRRDPDSFECI